MKKPSKKLIFTILSLLGVGTTTVLAVKSGMDAQKKISEAEKKPETFKETMSLTWRCYIATLISMIGTGVCIVTSHVLSENELKKLAGVVAAGATTLTAYRNKVADVIGADEEKKIFDTVRTKTDFQMYPQLPNSGDVPDDVLFYDGSSETYFYSNHERVQQAIYHLNRNFALRGEQSLEDWWEYLGIDAANPCLADYVWDAQEFWENGLVPWLDLEVCRKEREGKEYYELWFDWGPSRIDDNDNPPWED